MATCDICGKNPFFGKSVSFSHEMEQPPVGSEHQRLRALVDNTPTRVNACTSCLRPAGHAHPEATRHRHVTTRRGRTRVSRCEGIQPAGSADALARQDQQHSPRASVMTPIGRLDAEVWRISVRASAPSAIVASELAILLRQASSERGRVADRDARRIVRTDTAGLT
jgi:large subunit ribosomal protein L28